MDGKSMVVTEEKHLIPLDKVNGYDVRPGFYGINGAKRGCEFYGVLSGSNSGGAPFVS